VTALNDLAALFYYQSRYADAEPFYKRSLAIREKSLGPVHPDVATSLSNLAALYAKQSRYADAEPFYKRSLAIREKALGPNHPDVANSLNNLAELYYTQGRYTDAEPLYKRSLAISEKAQGLDHPEIAIALNNLAALYDDQGRYADSELLYNRSLAIREKALGPDHPDVAGSLINLAALYHGQGRFADAEPLYKRSLAIREKALGPDHPDVAFVLNNLAVLYSDQARYADAEPLYKRSLAIREKALGPNHPDVAFVLNNLAKLYDDLGRWPEALPLVRTATERGYVSRSTHLSVLLGAARSKDLTEDMALNESFVVVQRAASTAASAALSQLAVRFAAGSDELAQLVRKDQDLSAENERLDKNLIAALSKPPNQRDANREAATRKRLTEIADAQAEVSRILAQRFPDYAALSKPQPLAVSNVSSLLTNDEALVLIDLGKGNGAGKDGHSYIWVVDRSSAVWKTIDIKPEELATKIAALRASLEPGSNQPFDAKLAYELYRLILGPIDDVIAKKHRLLMVMNGALTSLPPQVLVTRDPAGKDLKSIDWLIKRQAIAILPSVYSLRVLRGDTARGAAANPLIGFGDPIFKKGGTEVKRITSNRGYAGFYRGPRADLDALANALPPLPETADELRAVAKSLDAPQSELRLESEATETAVKQAKLDQYRIVYFATHALVSGETSQVLKGTAEPALALSLPATATDLDDGLLTASEVAQLKLNADWVVLSACNTAAAEKPGAEALSGLARAFIYAGARALLVSHWPVESYPAVRLMTVTFEALAKNPKLTTAEALQQGMIAVMEDRANPHWANPTSWAPFVLVGEGGVLTR
jgi:CHAT domain-containing protein/tetratricopeptide (TPR) repeat protein